LNVYVLRNGLNRQFISAFDNESSAIAERNNLLKVGIYRKIDLETMPVSSDAVTSMSVVKVEGYLAPTGPKLTVTPYTPASGITVVDKLTFNVTTRAVTFVGFANMTADEIAATDITSLKNRLTGWIEQSFTERIENDNPSDPEPVPEDNPTPEPDPGTGGGESSSTETGGTETGGTETESGSTETGSGTESSSTETGSETGTETGGEG
jgi:hypothetical protein